MQPWPSARMSDNSILIGAKQLKAFAADVFVSAGVSVPDAECWADVLVWAELRGAESHGVLRIPRYVERIDECRINLKPKMNVERSTGPTLVVEADFAPGPVGMCFATDEAIHRANQSQIGWCVVRNITHCGAIGYYALRAARKGMAAIVMSASSPMMAYQGSRESAVSTNPIALAVPGSKHAPLLLDMSTAIAGRGKILRAIANGVNIPADWGLDENGRPTTDPNEVATLLPLGGAKGSSLSLMIECFTSLFVNNAILEPALAGRGLGSRTMNGLVVAIDISAFGDADLFCAEVDALAGVIGGLPRVDSVAQIYAPGERGDAVMVERKKTGIPLAAQTWQKLKALADRFGLPMLQQKNRT